MPNMRTHETQRGLLVYFDAEDLSTASLDDVPIKLADSAAYVAAVSPSGKARVLKNRRGPKGFLDRTTELALAQQKDGASCA